MMHRQQRKHLSSAGKPPQYQYPGTLPTLGLNKYKNVDLLQTKDKSNPFSVEKETEKLLLVREQERDHKGHFRQEHEN